MLDVTNFCLKDYNRVGEKEVYLHKGLLPETKICRYIPIDYLVEMLSRRNLYVSNRKYLNDKREQGIKEDLRAIFPISPCYRSKKMTKQEADRISRLHRDAYSTCVSCWTMRTEESIMLWHCYGQNTCRISTTIKDFLNSIDPKEYTILVAPIRYDSNEFSARVDDKIFCKHIAYKDEQEIRLCICSEEHHVSLDINVEKMINEILLNPFWEKDYLHFIEESIEQKYAFLTGKIHYSHLLEKK